MMIFIDAYLNKLKIRDMIKINKIFNQLLNENMLREELKFNDGKFNKQGPNTIYLDDKPIVDFGVSEIGTINIHGQKIPNAIFLKGGYNATEQGKGYGSLGINFIFKKLPKIQNLVLQCYETACPFWEKMGGKIIRVDNKTNASHPIKTIVINRNDFMNEYGYKFNNLK